MNATDLLKAQHRQAERLFEAIKGAEGDEKLRLFFELADSLAIHTTIEERHFYPELRQRAEAVVVESLADHRVVKRTLSDLLRTDIDDAAFDVKLGLLEDKITRHVGDEENDLFPRAQRILGAERLAEIADEMIETVAELADREPRPDVHAEGDDAPSP